MLPELYRATVWWSCPLHCDAWFVNIAGMCYLIGSEGERKGGRDGERRECIHVRIREKQTLLINHLILIWIIILPRVYSRYYIRCTCLLTVDLLLYSQSTSWARSLELLTSNIPIEEPLRSLAWIMKPLNVDPRTPIKLTNEGKDGRERRKREI